MLSPDLPGRTACMRRNSHFSAGRMRIPASVRVSWRGVGGPFFAKKVPQILLLDKVERDGDEGQEEQHNGRPAQKRPLRSRGV